LGSVIRLGFVANPFSLPVALAFERGYFRDAGVDVQVERFTNGSAASTALAEGSIEVGVSGHVQTLMASRTTPQVFIAPLGFEESPDHLPIALLGTGGVHEPADLENKRVAVSALGAISELQVRILMREAGAAYDRVELVAMPFKEMGEALRGGRVGAASVPEPFASALVATGNAHVIDRGSLSVGLHPGERAMIAGLATTARWLEDQPDGTGQIVEAIGRAVDELNAEPALAPSMMVAQVKERLDPALVQPPLFDRRLAVPDLQRVFDLALDHGLLDHAADASSLIA
jgi:NitT/TauT family transport system substrate-binding protein